MENNQRGRFIVFEGIDGAGKTTQIDLLEKYLKEKGRRVFRTAEPTESVSGGLLRDALGGVSRRSACEMAALFVLDRVFHNVNPVCGIRKMLDEGFDVICDRYYYSSMAYQGSETDFDWVKRMNVDCPEILRPDACVFLDLSPEVSLERISKGRATREIYETVEKLTAVRERFLNVFEDLKKDEHIYVINAANSVPDVHEDILCALAI